jgi:hypothetical protein
MKFRTLLFLYPLLFLATLTAFGQVDSSSKLSSEAKPARTLGHQMILPGALVTYGLVALNSKQLISLDNQIKEEVWVDHPHQPFRIDNYVQYLPGFSVYGLHAMGIYGKNPLRTATKRYLISSVVMSVIVQSVKMISKIQRPNGSGNNAFPSGHTATAFVGAEFLNQEYGYRSPWYSIGGYILATAVGYMRIYNNRHWARDVVAGAGVGIGTTKLVYGLARQFKAKERINARSPYLY